MRKIILASTSSRRKEILTKTGFVFEVAESNHEEDMNLSLAPVDLAKYLSLGKAKAVAKRYNDAIIIAADTFVVYDDHVLGKPKTESRAKEMLEMLSGKEHEVLTGVAIIDTANGRESSFVEITKVFMKHLTLDIIQAYINTGEPLDKGGSYALQERGALLIEKIEGDFFNVMGLPVMRLAEELEKFGVK